MFEYELEQLERNSLLRRMTAMEPVSGTHARIQGRDVILFCSNDYLGLSSHPALREAAARAMERYGFGPGASRLISGTSPLHIELEERIAAFKGTEAALVFNSGYAANTGAIPAIASDGDAIFSDSLNHASIIDGCRLSRARVHVYRHRDLDYLEGLLKEAMHARRRLIVTDSVFSMDGDIAPLPGLAALAEKYDAILMVDDAHATGVLGRNGRGSVEHFGIEGKVHVQMGTLGKAFGSFGAYIAGDKGLIRYLLNSSRSFVFSTALPPAVCAASIAAMEIFSTEPERLTRLWRMRERFASGLSSIGIDVSNSETPIIPIIIGEGAAALEAAGELLSYGVYAPAIRPPSVPAGKARIRTSVSAGHTEAEIDTALEAFFRLKKKGYLPDAARS